MRRKDLIRGLGQKLLTFMVVKNEDNIVNIITDHKETNKINTSIKTYKYKN